MSRGGIDGKNSAGKHIDSKNKGIGLKSSNYRKNGTGEHPCTTMPRIAVVTSGYLPVPAALGGAVEALVDYLIDENEKNPQCEFVIFSCHHPRAEESMGRKCHAFGEFIKTPLLIRILDKWIYLFAKKILGKKKVASYRYILQRLHFMKKVARRLAVEDYDKVLIENHASLFLTLKWKNNFKKYIDRYFYHLHNEQDAFYSCERIIGNTCRIMTVSSYISNSIRAALGGIDAKRIGVLRNCVDVGRFGSPEALAGASRMRDGAGILPREKVVLFTGRLSPEKGIRELMDAFRILLDQGVDGVKLVIAGGYLSGATDVQSGYERELEELAASMGDRIIFTGFIPYDRMPSVYCMADVAVIPSIWDDPAPLTVIETITSGIPLITTRSGGIPEYAHEECAILLKRDDELVPNMAKAIVSLLGDPDRRMRMAEAGRKISQGWTIESYYRSFIQMMNSPCD